MNMSKHLCGSIAEISGSPSRMWPLILIFSLLLPIRLKGDEAKLGEPTMLIAQGSASSQSASGVSRNSAVITNQDITDMLKAGISAEIVVSKMRASKCQCDTSPAALEGLKSAGVPDSVILAMIQSDPPALTGLDDIQQAKSVYLVDKGADVGVFDHLTERLQKVAQVGDRSPSGAG